MNTGTMPPRPVFVFRAEARSPAFRRSGSHGLAPWFLSLFAVVLLLGALFCAATARADLRDFAPDSATVTTASAALVTADNKIRILQLTNTGTYDVWLAHGKETAVVGKGFYLPVGSTIKFSGDDAPQQGLTAIADGGSTTVAIGKG